MTERALPDFPYADLMEALVAATMRAQRSVVEHLASRRNGQRSLDLRLVNREFTWLAYLTPDGKNRHLIEAPEGMAPLRKRILRNKGSLPAELREAFENMTYPREVTASGKQDPASFMQYVQDQPTRISSLILESFTDHVENGAPTRSLAREADPEPTVDDNCPPVLSPLAIVYEYLTVPDMPGTRAYALMACRNYLFFKLGIVPSLGTNKRDNDFEIKDIETALSHIWTSMRPRYLSKGEDKLPPGKAGSVHGLLRHFLAMKRMLRLRFRSTDDCVSYFASQQLLPAKLPPSDLAKSPRYAFEFSKSPFLDRLPDIGEIVNELWGLPIPIRGADTVFRGGLKFSARQGLVMAVHGGPGSGKTSFALALGAYVAPFGVDTLFFTAEELKRDLIERIGGLIPDAISRLSFFPGSIEDCMHFTNFGVPESPSGDTLRDMETALGAVADNLREHDGMDEDTGAFVIPKACSAVIVLDGMHDLFAVGHVASDAVSERGLQVEKLYGLVATLRDLHALVIVTTGMVFAADSALDYLVDIAIRLTHESVEDFDAKPDRRLTLAKARHQLCATGTHGFQIGGQNGVRFSPQINYQLHKRAIWKPRIPDRSVVRLAMQRATTLPSDPKETRRRPYVNSAHSVQVPDGSHVFMNGQGSGGKAALALKLALSPLVRRADDLQQHVPKREKVLVVSFLYAPEYYDSLHKRIVALQSREYGDILAENNGASRLNVMHLYPGYLRPHNLYNRIEWELDAAELLGDPYTSVVIDGIHNVFLQFPEISKYGLFWPQIYSSLRSRRLTTITTHTTLAVPYVTDAEGRARVVDDRRSEPLRHALVQRTDFQLEIDPWLTSPFGTAWQLSGSEFVKYSGLFVLKVVSAIDQKIPTGFLLWSREDITLYEFPALPPTQGRLI